MLSTDFAAGAREKALNSLFDLSATWFEAGQRLTGIYASAGREAVHQGSRPSWPASATARSTL